MEEIVGTEIDIKTFNLTNVFSALLVSRMCF